MPRDRRLWVKVSTDIGRHPKMAALSDAAFRAYIECLAHAKELNQDGFIPVRDARRWMPEFAELLTNDPARPSVVEVENGYRVHDFTVHQETAESVENRRAASRANGAKGGRPAKPRNLDGNPSGNPRDNPRVKAESRVQSPEILTGYVSESQSLGNRASAATDSMYTSQITERLAKQAGITDPAKLARLIHQHTGCTVAWDHLPAIVNHCVSKSKTPVKSGQAYAITCITDSAMEVQDFIYQSGFAA